MTNLHTPYNQFVTGVEGLRIAVYSERYYQVHMHRHDDCEIIYVKKGVVRIDIDKSHYYAKEGEVYVLQPHVAHSITVDEHTSERNEFHYYIINFDDTMIGCENDLVLTFLKSIKVDTKVNLSASTLSLFPKMRKWDIEKPDGYEIFLKTGLLQIINEIITTKQYIKLSALPNVSAEKNASSVNHIVTYIEHHYQESISVDDLADMVGYSASHLHRIFKAQMGVGIVEYLNKYRIDKACIELLHTSKSITQVATDCGFLYVQNFSKTFKAYMDISPLQYRKRALAFAKAEVPAD